MDCTHPIKSITVAPGATRTEWEDDGEDLHSYTITNMDLRCSACGISVCARQIAGTPDSGTPIVTPRVYQEFTERKLNEAHFREILTENPTLAGQILLPPEVTKADPALDRRIEETEATIVVLWLRLCRYYKQRYYGQPPRALLNRLRHELLP